MKMTKEEAFEMLKGTKVYAGEQSKEVQAKLFEIGFMWLYGGETFNDCTNIIIGTSGILCSSGNTSAYFKCHNNKQIPISKILNIKLEPKYEFNHGLNYSTMLDDIDEFNSALDNAVNNIKDAMEKAVLSSLINNSVKKLSDDISKIKEIFNK